MIQLLQLKLKLKSNQTQTKNVNFFIGIKENKNAIAASSKEIYTTKKKLIPHYLM